MLKRKREEIEEDISIKEKERAEKKLKYERQRKLDAVKRKQTIKQRNKLYQLIDSGKITKIFAQKSASVLAEEQNIAWGNEEEAAEAEAFMEDSTQATSSDESEDSEEERKKKKEKAKERKLLEKERDENEAKKLAADGNTETKEKSNKVTNAAGAGESEKSNRGFLNNFFSRFGRNKED